MDSKGAEMFAEISNSHVGNGTVESDDLELWLTQQVRSSRNHPVVHAQQEVLTDGWQPFFLQQPHLMHEIIRVGSRAVEVADVIAEQIGGEDKSFTMKQFAEMVPTVTAAARKVLERAAVEPLEYDYSRRVQDYGF